MIFWRRPRSLRDSVFSSMIYPLILLGTGGLSIIVLLTYVLPKFSVIFSELGGAMPLPTQVLLAVSQGLRDYWWLMIAVPVTLGILFKKNHRFPRRTTSLGSI